MSDASQSSAPLAGRIALVTGASRGIGRAVALRLAKEGAHVVAMARTQGALEELDDEIRKATGSPATLVAENITDFDKIDRVGAALYQRYGKLDILVGNAGYLGQLSPVGHYTPKMWDEIFAVNVTANWRLIRSFDVLLRASDAGRAMFVTSGVAHKARMYWGPYAASKAALEQMVKIYAAECAHTALRVNIINPGRVRTKMRAKAYPGEDPNTLATPDMVTDIFVRAALPAFTETGQTLSAQAPK
ncbi:MAG: SDR family NAD(P)-dependent oxidoreductase [Rhodospirillaceae bacterium]|nr:MAG: SDR family NAD(P)-dependent oxidoreductase [Rhodospirillaceae bacterium]